ncbi:hypothetical protein cypCar_00042336 [Cyprinus carpio]|nr:hypothetical protein cypCar_00042336 [Cyprinus carpio]
MRCTFKIIGESPQTFVLQISNVDVEDFNGLPGKGVFSPSQKLTKRLSAEFSQPIVFEFSKGQITDIRTAPGVSNTVVNIVRGILGFLQVTVKTTQSFYELVELGIHGVCQSSYTVEEDSNAKELIVSQMVDITNCQQPAALYRGMALAPEDKLSKQRGESVVSTVKHTYTVKSTADGGLITKAFAQERQYFTPFNVKGGNSRLLALRDIELLKVSDTTDKIVTGQMQSRGNLIYKTEKDLRPIPVILDLIKRLAQANIYHVDSASSTDILNLIQLLRVATLENLEQLWKQVSGNDEHRRWFLDLVVEVTDERILKFLETRFKAGDITANEAGQALVVAFNHLSAEPVSVALAQEFLTIPFSKSHPLMWNTVVLAYGSLVYRYCVYTDPCPITVVQPLLDMATSGLSKNSEEDMVLALKALGNAAHPSSIKTLLKFLPGYTAGAEKLPIRVQDIVLNLFVQRTLPAEIRMLACMVLLETKPSIALISVISEVLLEETDLQVASFSYSLLKGISKSRTPDNQHLSTACNIAIKILTPKLGHLSYRYSKNVHLDWFHDDFLFGTSADIYMLQNESLIPTKLMLKGKMHFIGRILQFLEFGFRADGLKELLVGKTPQLKKGITDFATIMNIVSIFSLRNENVSNEMTYEINIEDPSLFKITPMMPETEDSQKGLPLARILPTSRHDQTKNSEVKFRQCADAKIYGTSVCIEAEAKRAHYLHEYPLYYFLGHTRFSYQLEPAEGAKPIEKIQIQVTAGRKNPPGVSEMMNLSHRVFKDTRDEITSCGENNLSNSFPASQDLDATPESVITVKALGLSPPAKPLGYEGVAFYLPTAQRDNIEMIVSDVGEEANWKMCANANTDKSQTSAKAHLRWGAECQTYDLSMRVSAACQPESKPSIYTKITWGALPSVFTMIGQRIQEYVPGISYIMGFYQKYEKNPERQAAVTVVVSSSQTFDMRVKIPERTIYKKAIPSPIDLAGFEAVNFTIST